MNEQYEKSLTKLELDKVLALLADHAASQAAKDRCMAIRPSADADEIRHLLEQDRQHLDEMQVEMKLAREFYLVVRLKNEKRETVYSLLSTIEESLHKSGLPVRRAGREELKRILALYFEENTTSERMEDYDGQRFLEG